MQLGDIMKNENIKSFYIGLGKYHDDECLYAKETEKELGRRPRVICDNFLDASNKKKEYENKYRINYTLGLLKKCGLDVDEFKNTWIYCSNPLYVLGCIHDKMDGYDYDEKISRIPNGHAMDLSKTICFCDGDKLVLKDNEVEYVFYVDIHKIIYVNGINELGLKGVPTKEEYEKIERESLESLREDMEADRLQHDRRMQRSMEYAKHFWVKD